MKHHDGRCGTEHRFPIHVARLDDGRMIPLSAPIAFVTSGEHRFYLPVQDERALLSRQAHHQLWDGLSEDDAGGLELRLGPDRLRVTLARA